MLPERPSISCKVYLSMFFFTIRNMIARRPILWVLLTILVFGVIYSLISFVNHYLFRTYALDLGAYTNALYDYAHLRWNDSLAFSENAENLLADHFDLYLVIFSPLALIFGTYTLLVVQLIAILIGGWGVYRFIDSISARKILPLLAMIHFFLFFGIYSAMAFDYHSNVVAAMLVPWFFYFFRKQRYVQATIIVVAMIIAKENISLWLVFIFLGLVLEYRKDKKRIRYLLFFAAGAALYFVAITQFIMPAISESQEYHHFHYSVLGEDIGEALAFLVTHPIESIRVLFVNHLEDPLGNYVKAETYLFLLLSGMFLLLFRPSFLIMLIPVFFQKMYHDNIWLWSVDAQYSIEFAPIITIGVFTFIASFRRLRWVTLFSTIAIVGSLFVTVRLMDNTIIYTNKAKIRFYQDSHYQRNYDVRIVHKQLASIPDNAVVSAHSPFLPHLALRNKVYQFPVTKDAEYVVFSFLEETYPLEKNSFIEHTFRLMSSGDWEIIYNDNGFVILRSRYSDTR